MSVIDLNPFNAILSRLEGVADRLEKGVAGAAPGGVGAASASSAGPVAAAAAVPDDPAIATSFDAFTSVKLPEVEKAAKEVNAKDVTEATETFVLSVRMLRQVFAATGRCRKPKDAEWPKVMAKALELGQQAHKACDNRSDYFQHRKSVAEALNLMMLVTNAAPPAHVQNTLECMDYNAVKVMQKKKDADTAWVKAIKAFVKDLKDWCTENCKLGLIWNAQGEDPVEYFTANPLGEAPKAAAAPAAKGKGRGAAPPPPKGGFASPPPDRWAEPAGAKAAAPAAGGMTAVFSAIGNFSTGNLKKVTADMKTKNQVRDGPSTVPAAKAPAAAPAGRSSGKGPRGPPVKELQRDVNWMIENYDGVPDLVLDEAEKQHLVCIINCRNTTVKINNKVKSINIDGCEKVNVIFQDVISAVELVNSERCQVQTTGKVNAFAIDKCNGVNVFLSKESMAAEITSSKSSEMNVTIPDGDDGDIIEIPIPEQFVSRFAGPKKLVTEVSSIYSG